MFRGGDVGSRTQRTGDLFPSSAESSSTRYDARTAGRWVSWKHEDGKGAFWSQNENLETRSSGCQVFFSLHIHSNPKILYLNFSYMADFTLPRHCNLLRRRIGTHYLNDDRHSRHRMTETVDLQMTNVYPYLLVCDRYLHAWSLKFTAKSRFLLEVGCSNQQIDQMDLGLSSISTYMAMTLFKERCVS